MVRETRSRLSHLPEDRDRSHPPRERVRVAVEPMETQDVPRAWAIEVASFPVPWTRSIFLETLAAPRHRSLVARVGLGVIGYAVLWFAPAGPGAPAEELHLLNLAVDPAWRRQGVGSQILEAILRTARAERLRTVTLEVRPSNHEALRLYERYGFVPMGRRRRYYSDTGEDALLMTLDLASEAQGGSRP